MSDERFDETLRQRSARAGAAEVRSLLEEAGERPAVPAADLALLRAAARAEWERVAAASGRRPAPAARWRLAAGLAAAAAAGIAVAHWWPTAGPGAAPAEKVARIEALRGAVGARAAAAPERVVEVAVGTPLVAGTTLETGSGPAPGRLAVRWHGGAALRFDADTKVTLVSRGEIRLERGAVWVDSDGADPARAPLEIVTAHGRVREIGTRYEVRVGAAAWSVRVRDGRLAVETAAATHEVDAGARLELGADGATLGTGSDRDPPGRDWWLEIAPAFDIEGESLPAFLAWVAHETGWRVRFADEALAAEAARIRLHGTIEGLRPDQAAEVVLPGTGLVHHVEDGELRIERALRTRP